VNQTSDRLVKTDGATIGLRSITGADYAWFAQNDLVGVVAMACAVHAPFSIISRYRPLVTMDMRGQTIRGSEVASADEISLEKYFGDFETVQESLKAKRVAYFGYSPGGFFMTHYAIAKPKQVAALILAEPAIYTDTENLMQRAELAEKGDAIRAMEAMLTYIDPSLSRSTKIEEAKQVAQDWQSSEIMGRVFRLHAEHQINDDDLKPLREVPTLLIAGTESPMSFHVKRIASLVPEAHVWWVKGATHLDLMDERFAPQIAEVTNMFLEHVV
jgi:pimeloyl-ACP methyl ester carboxylesterase